VNRASQAGLCPCASSYAHYFGAFTFALKAARLDQRSGRDRAVWRAGQPIKYSEVEILVRLRELGQELGRTPVYCDLVNAGKRPGFPSVGTIVRHFGRLSTALKRAGFDSNERKGRAREALIEQLRRLTRELRRIPTSRDISAAQGRCSAPMTFVRHFGSMVAARKAARTEEVLMEIGALGRPSRVGERFERDALIGYLRALAQQLGRPPSSGDIRKACRENGGPGARPFLREFGGIPAERKAAQLDDLFVSIQMQSYPGSSWIAARRTIHVQPLVAGDG
jgi:hypothetical protein